MTFRLMTAAIMMASVGLAGCSASPTEAAFGQAVRANLAEQRVLPQPVDVDAEPVLDGQRIEGVMEVYRTLVGDPLPVVRVRPVERD
jgi:hypothetical protein